LATVRLERAGDKTRAGGRVGRFFDEGLHTADPFDILREFGAPRTGAAQSRAEAERRTMRNAERKALHTLGLDDSTSGPEIKARFKELVKRHHPDANGGDRTSEDNLREIIEAYNYLKKTGCC